MDSGFRQNDSGIFPKIRYHRVEVRGQYYSVKFTTGCIASKFFLSTRAIDIETIPQAETVNGLNIRWILASARMTKSKRMTKE